jgi:hypothetical protein
LERNTLAHLETTSETIFGLSLEITQASYR